MDVEFYATRAQASVLATREQSEIEYDNSPDQLFFFSFIDLAHSSNYRIANGAKKGYVRSETFFALINTIIQPCTDLQPVKEIGDEVLLMCPYLRPLFEAVVLVDQTARQLNAVAGERNFPFSVRAAIGHGPVKKLKRTQPDFLGSPIDQLARLMSVPPKDTNILIHEDAYRNAGDVLEEYSEFASFGNPKPLKATESKDMIKHVLYREVFIDHISLLMFRKHFVQWAGTKKSGGE